MKVYVTKYALTRGILLFEVKPPGADFPDMVQFDYGFFHKPDWHESWEEAILHAEDMRVKAMAALDKKRFRVETKRFAKPKKVIREKEEEVPT